MATNNKGGEYEGGFNFLQLVWWTPSFVFLLEKKYYVCQTGSDKGKRVSSHIVALVLGKMWYRSRKNNQICTSSVNMMAKQLGVSINTVKRSIQVLEEMGLVQNSGSFSEYGTVAYWVFEELILKRHEEFAIKHPLG